MPFISAGMECELCGVRLAIKEFWKHMFSEHSVSRPALYPCPRSDCGSCFGERSKLWRHLATTHGVTSPYMCDKCPEAFAESAELFAHERDVHGCTRGGALAAQQRAKSATPAKPLCKQRRAPAKVSDKRARSPSPSDSEPEPDAPSEAEPAPARKRARSLPPVARDCRDPSGSGAAEGSTAEHGEPVAAGGGQRPPSERRLARARVQAQAEAGNGAPAHGHLPVGEEEDRIAPRSTGSALRRARATPASSSLGPMPRAVATFGTLGESVRVKVDAEVAQMRKHAHWFAGAAQQYSSRRGPVDGARG
ncbi:hypothetical protein T492DRAFT_382820 [Pavlovales sp. CCMP2436]|nr:hypothetical protein T492DRAFT_382820 [Pavlovales sp. CCMP2436]